MSAEDNDDFPEWPKKRRTQPEKSFLSDVEKMFQEIEKIMEDGFNSFQEKIPKEYSKEHKLQDKDGFKEFGPYVYGYSIKNSVNGKPDIQKFENIKINNEPETKKEREMLVDVVENIDEVHVVAELPNVEKTDIKLYGTDDTITIAVNTIQHKYYKEVELPAKICAKKAKSTYKNGVLEVVIPKLNPTNIPKGDPIDIN
ncbi:MAG: Hsp20/alpha crystallin family protein [Candidatus Bathyarchaeota archaeon]|nr:Hsp20/alpha crystallin family protein [Candidatus Termiticorpusculum sp.]